ncbi:hypothetical protein Fcan01_13772 [Folsomia candida]|uniref:Uncharacterized protein n=1 Tax=Folsomia candida TaxID=158441 RepID=A0A226E3S1_FOLCA|nr:hypothetical protein Fcan01_13772 [Folsomia candida]
MLCKPIPPLSYNVNVPTASAATGPNQTTTKNKPKEKMCTKQPPTRILKINMRTPSDELEEEEEEEKPNKQKAKRNSPLVLLYLDKYHEMEPPPTTYSKTTCTTSSCLMIHDLNLSLSGTIQNLSGTQ